MNTIYFGFDECHPKHGWPFNTWVLVYSEPFVWAHRTLQKITPGQL